MNNDQLAINAIRVLSIEAITKAKSGHPGIALGAAPMIYTLYKNHMNINPKNPEWFNRDRFVLSAGHGSVLLYSTLHMFGYDISIEDIKQFRQLKSITPGHPEVYHTPGVDATSGPLGQGIGMGVGMAIAENHLHAKYGNIVNHYTYVICGDGDLQEGITQEAMSLAGHLKERKLIVLYDSNDIQLDGPVNNANSEDVKTKYEAMNWHYQLVEDGNDIEAINLAIIKAKASDSPSIIEVKTIIGYGAKNMGTSSVHGSPLSNDAVCDVKDTLGCKDEAFCVTKEMYDTCSITLNRGKKINDLWDKEIKKHPDLIKLINCDYDIKELSTYKVGEELATRNAAGKVMNELSEMIPTLIGGSADLTVSTKIKGVDGNYANQTPLGRNINFGVREHAMGAIANGMTLHKGVKSFTGAFFVFSDYMRPSMRMASIMGIPALYMFSHDTIAVGEDGPTHQPVEQIMSLRCMPNMHVYRPADANEMVYAVKHACQEKNTPSSILSTRQAIKVLENTSYEGVSKGGYIVSKEDGKLDGILLAAGSEVRLAVDAKEVLKKEGIDVRVVSMVSMDIYDSQTNEYKDSILPKKIKTLAIEMGSTMGWYKYTTNVFGIDKYGKSGPLKDVLKEFGFTTDNIVKIYKKLT